MRGDGRVFRPKRGGKLLDVWYYRIRLGKRLKEGRGFKTKAEAIEALKEERKRKARGEFVPPEQDRLTVAGVLDSYLSALKDRGAKSVASVVPAGPPQGRIPGGPREGLHIGSRRGLPAPTAGGRAESGDDRPRG